MSKNIFLLALLSPLVQLPSNHMPQLIFNIQKNFTRTTTQNTIIGAVAVASVTASPKQTISATAPFFYRA
jgi:hypothetical protein